MKTGLGAEIQDGVDDLRDDVASQGPILDRNHVMHRNKYLSRLAYAGVWQNKSSTAKSSSKSTTITIFDWDDTLFPTSAFSPKTQDEMMEIAEKNKELFLHID